MTRGDVAEALQIGDADRWRPGRLAEQLQILAATMMRLGTTVPTELCIRAYLPVCNEHHLQLRLWVVDWFSRLDRQGEAMLKRVSHRVAEAVAFARCQSRKTRRHHSH